MSDIFISYAREDRDWAKRLAEVLELQNWTIWWDRNIPPGKSFDQVIEEALDSAKCVIVLWSKASVASDWVKNEATEGLRRRILVPGLIEGVKIPLEFRRIQTADLSDWDGVTPHPEFVNLLSAISDILGTPLIKAANPESTKKPEREYAQKPGWLQKQLKTAMFAGLGVAALALVVIMILYDQPDSKLESKPPEPSPTTAVTPVPSLPPKPSEQSLTTEVPWVLQEKDISAVPMGRWIYIGDFRGGSWRTQNLNLQKNTTPTYLVGNTYKVSANTMNIRERPYSGSIVGTLNYGQKVKLTRIFVFGDGTEGFIWGLMN